jgi:hypothetical protein
LASKCVAGMYDVTVLGEAPQHVLDALLQGIHLTNKIKYEAFIKKKPLLKLVVQNGKGSCEELHNFEGVITLP